MNNYKSVRKRLFTNSEVELKSESVELALVDDIENKFKKGVSAFNSAKNTYLKATSDLGQVLFIFEDDIANDVSNLKKKIKDLGLDMPQNIKKN